MQRIGMIAAACGIMTAGTALANDANNLLTNPGFETEDKDDLPLGWLPINVGTSDYVTDGEPGAFVRTGEHAIKIGPNGDTFRGWTTNSFLPDGSDLYDPDYTYLGGDVHISGWYLVPEGQELINDAVGIKLEFRREPPNFSIWAAFELFISQTATDGQWVQFQAAITDEQILAVGDFPPHPTSVSVLPFRFNPGPGAPAGTIFWDDLCLIQGDLPGGCNDADIAEPFGILDLADIATFIDAFVNQQDAADIAPPTGTWDLSDISAFVGAFTAGCP